MPRTRIKLLPGTSVKRAENMFSQAGLVPMDTLFTKTSASLSKCMRNMAVTGAPVLLYKIFSKSYVFAGASR